MKKKKLVIILSVVAAVLIAGVVGGIYVNNNYGWAFAIYPKSQINTTSSADSLPISQPSLSDSDRYASFKDSEKNQTINYDKGQAEINVNKLQYSMVLNYDYSKSVDYKKYKLSFEIVQYVSNGKQKVSYGDGSFSQNEKKIGMGIYLPSYKHGSQSWIQPATYTVDIFFSPTDDNSKLNQIDCGTYVFAVNERGFITGSQKKLEVA